MTLSQLVHFARQHAADLLNRHHPPRLTADVERLPVGHRLSLPEVFVELQPAHEAGVDRPDADPVEAPPVDEESEVRNPDRAAYYLPFHFYGPRTWGIYLREVGIVGLAASLTGPLPYDEALLAALDALRAHERTHAMIEAAATRVELLTGAPVYARAFAQGPGFLREEAMANAAGSTEVCKKYPQAAPLLDTLWQKGPPGYRDFPQYLGSLRWTRGRQEVADEFCRVAGLMAAQGPREFLCAPLTTADHRSIPTYIVLDGRHPRQRLSSRFLRTSKLRLLRPAGP